MGNTVAAVLVILALGVLSLTIVGTLLWFVLTLYRGFRQGKHVQ